MKNWDKLEADVNKILTVHYTKGRDGAKVNKVVVHYNYGNLTTEGCYSVWQTRPASAHYQVEDDGRIGQLVWDSNTAWHASNWQANISSIGIEHANRPDGTITEQCLDNGAHLVAAVCKYYGLGRPQWLKNVFPHKYFASTSCPGQIYGSQKNDYIARAQYWYDKMNGKDVQKPSSSGSSSSSSGSSKLTVDGYWGTSTTKALQRYFGTPVDGVVSSQSSAWKKRNPGLTGGWEWVGNPVGSQLIIAMQKKLGVTADGLFGPKTANALIKHFKASSGASVYDGKLDGRSLTIKAMQKALNSNKF